jgi:hypothetical protein
VHPLNHAPLHSCCYMHSIFELDVCMFGPGLDLLAWQGGGRCIGPLSDSIYTGTTKGPVPARWAQRPFGTCSLSLEGQVMYGSF